MAIQNIKEIKIREIYKESFSILRSNFKDILLVILIIYIPINIFLFLIGGNEMSMGQFMKVNRWVELLVGIIADMAIVIIVKEAFLNKQKLSYRAALSMALKKWNNAVMANFIQGIIVGLLTILLIIPGLIWFIYYTFTMQAVILKDLKGKEALDYSKGLVKGNWWKIFGYIILTWLICIILGILSGIPFDLLELPSYLSVISDTIFDFFITFVVITTTVFFLRVEGTYEDKEATDAEASEQV